MDAEDSHRLLDKSREPMTAEIETLLGEIALTRLDRLDAFLAEGHGAVRELTFPFGNRYGWGYKYSFKNKMLCYVFFEQGAFTVTLSIGKGELARLAQALPSLLPRTRELWENRYPCGDGGWIHYRLLRDEELADVETLVGLKIKQKRS